ncbi:hypothetical protein ACTG9Q_31070 [Actinokineospora sp. 24-640]
MNLRELRASLRGGLVWAEPYEHDGVTVLRAAAVIGGGGGGEEGPASGLGLGLVTRPVGAFVIRKGEARWVPAVDLTRIALGLMAAAVLVARARRS